MRHFHYYDSESGLLHGDALVVNSDDRHYGDPGHRKMALANCPPGHKPIEGRFDPLSQRVDVATGKVVSYQPDSPSSDYEWHADSKRWRLKPDVAAAQARRVAALAEIARLESGQDRAVREAVLTGNHDRLAELEARIAALRKEL